MALGPEPDAMRLRLHRAAGEAPTQLHLTLFRRGAAASISDVVPIMENFGMRVIAEHPYEIHLPQGVRARIQDFELECVTPFDIGKLAHRLTAAIESVWTGATENDGFNRLLPLTGLAVREIMVLRACARYLLQTGLPFSQSYMELVLQANPGIALKLFELFDRRLNPARSAATRATTQPLEASIAQALEAVTSLDADRILRAFLHVIRAMVRTNFWQTSNGAQRPCLSFKLDSQAIPELPLPRPLFEVFVYSPEVEGDSSAHGAGGARRHPLVGSARGFPHRSAGTDEGTERQEHRHRAHGRQGRVRRQARRRREDGATLLPDLHARPAGPHRQHRQWPHRVAAAGDPT